MTVRADRPSPGLPGRVMALAPVAGLLLALLLVLLAPSRIVLPVATPVTGVPIGLSGVHGIERNDGRLMRWTTGRARLRWPGQFGVEPGAVVVSLAGFPGRQPDQLEARVNGRVSRHAVPAGYGEIRVDLPPSTQAPLDIELVSLTTRPAGDARDLGVRLESVTIERRTLSGVLRRVLGVHGIGIVALGALLWLAGAWAAGLDAPPARRLAWGALGWGIGLACVWLLGPTALRADLGLTLPPVVLGVLTTLLLARAGHVRLASVLSGLAIALQGIVCLSWFSAAFVDVPRWDIWDLVPFLVKQEAVGLTLHDLWSSHNEHRPTVARAVLLANVWLSRWNHWNELWMMMAITAVHVLVFVGAARRLGRERPWATVVALTGAGTFVATATQWENFLQGWQVALITGAMAISAAFALLTTGVLTWRRLVAAASLVLLGTAGFASCLLGWPLGAATIAVRRGPGWLPKAVTWLVFGVLVGVAYAHGLQRPSALPPPAPIFTSVTAIAQVTYGTCMALGMPVWYAPMSFSDTQSMAWWLLPTLGAAAVATAALLLVLHVARRETREAQAWLFPALLVAFGIGACGVTAIGRVPLGMHAMTASRYIVFTSLFWVGLLWLLTLATPLRSATGRRVGLTLAAVIVAAGLRGWGDSLPYIEEHFVSGSLGREALLREDWPNTVAIFPVPPVLDERRQVLKRLQLSLYRPGAR